MDTFKSDVAGKEFYFKPQKSGEAFVIEPYRQTGGKSFNMSKRKAEDADTAEKGQWQIAASANTPDWIKDLEKQFSDKIQERLDQAV